MVVSTKIQFQFATLLTLLCWFFTGCLDEEADANQSFTQGGCIMKASQGHSIAIDCPNGDSGTIFYATDDGTSVFCSARQTNDEQTTISCTDGTVFTDGKSGNDTLIRFEPEPSGSHCPYGGYTIVSGFDLNNDGVLSEDEINSRQYICHGNEGATGASGERGSKGDDGTSTLMRFEKEEAGENCPSGGVAILSGLDTDGDGSLSQDEVTDSAYICHSEQGLQGPPGQDGHDALVRLDEELPGANCPEGGFAVHSGIDNDRNGELDDTEITSTRYICHGTHGPAGDEGTPGAAGAPGEPGEDGEPGVDGKNSLIRLETIDPGPQCPGGGVVVFVGLDDDENGVLDDSEIDHSHTQLLCNHFLEARGVLDADSFTATGYATTNFTSNQDRAHAMVVQPDGKVIVAGMTDYPDGIFGLARYNEDGTLDATFGSNGVVTSSTATAPSAIHALALQSDGKIIAAGDALSSDKQIMAIARYHSNGTIDTSFGSDGNGFLFIDPSRENSTVRALAVDSSDRIVFTGASYFPSHDADMILGRLTKNGVVDTSFGYNGAATQWSMSSPQSVAISPDESIILGGTDGALSRVAKYSPTDVLISSFGSNGIQVVQFLNTHAPEGLTSLLVQSDGKIVVGGFSNINGEETFALARLLVNGDFDATFGNAGVVTTYFGANQPMRIHAIAQQSNSKFVAVGGNTNRFAIARYHHNGLLDPDFGAHGNGILELTDTNSTFGMSTAVAITDDKKILALGHQTYSGPTTSSSYGTRYILARIR